MGTLAITRKTANTLATAGAMNTNFDEIEAVVNALEADNISADAITAAKLNSDVVRADYGLKQHTDGSLQVDVSDTNPGLELSDGGLRAKVYGLASRTSNGIDIGRTGDMLLSSSATTPDGWTDISATYEGKMIRISATALSTGGSDTLSGDTGSHTLTSDEIPSHSHTLPISRTGTAGAYSSIAGAVAGPEISSDATGGGSGHTHTLTGVSCVPAYMTAKMYQKS